MIIEHGQGPEGARCSQCKHLKFYSYRTARCTKSRKRWWRLRAPACGLYEYIDRDASLAFEVFKPRKEKPQFTCKKYGVPMTERRGRCPGFLDCEHYEDCLDAVSKEEWVGWTIKITPAHTAAMKSQQPDSLTQESQYATARSASASG